MSRSTVVRALVLAGGALAALALLAGHVNREVLDGPTFADHVDDIRRDDAVATALGRSISTQLILAQPDLVAIRPLVEEIATRIAGGDLLAGPTRLAARAAHTQLTAQHADSVTLRIADAGAVVTGALAAAAPDRVPITSELSVTLATIGSQAYAPAVIELTELVGLLAWLLPLVALACFVSAIGLSAQRWDAAAATGRSLVGAAAGVAVLLTIGGFAVRRRDADHLGGAVLRAGWAQMIRPLWFEVAVLAAAGLAVALTCGGFQADRIGRVGRCLRTVVLTRPVHPAGLAVRGVLTGLIGIAAVVDPLGLIEPIIVLTGVGLVLVATSELAALAAGARTAPADDTPPTTAPSPPRSRRAVTAAGLAVAGVAVAVLLAGAVAQARPGGDVDLAGTGTAERCNGHAELCERRFDDVAYVASHNAMSVARLPGWYLAEQIGPIPTQLDQGARALLVDVWSGRPAGTVVRTAAASYEEALAIANAEVGPEVVDAALRVADSIAGNAVGPEARFLCHGLCETGATSFTETLRDIRVWLIANPDEVLTLFIEDHVDAALIAADVEAAGLLPVVHTPTIGAPWPSLGEMITSGRRLVVMLESGDGGEAAPWLVNGFDHTQETSFTFPTVESFSCGPNRGPEDAPLFLLNHWLAGFGSLVSDAQLVNARAVLLARAEQCRDERGQIPNFVAVNFVTLGDVKNVVDVLNGVA